MKRTVEIEDDLQERVDDAKEDIKDLLEAYYEDNPDVLKDDGSVDYNDLDNESIDEIVDDCVPAYTSEIKGLWYFHGEDFLDAYKSEGLGNDPYENNGAGAIYAYIRQEVVAWYFDNEEDICEEVRERMREKKA